MRRYALPIAWVLGSALALYGSFLGNPYLARYEVGPDEQHRLGIAVTFLILVTATCVVIAAVLRPKTYKNCWGRALVAALILSFMHWIFFLPLHQPVAVGFHAMWLLLMAAICWLLFIVSGISALAGRMTPNKSFERTRGR